MSRTLVLLVGVIFCLVCSQAYSYYTVTRDDINVRSDATTFSPSLGSLSKKDRLQVLGETQDWYNIVLPKRFKGFVWGTYIRKISARKGEVIASRLNIRQEPSLQALVIGQLPQGAVIAIRATAGDWLKIDPYPYANGWVHKKFLRPEPDEAASGADTALDGDSLSLFVTRCIERLKTATVQEKTDIQDELITKGQNVIPLLELYLLETNDSLAYSIIAVFTRFAQNDSALISYFLKKTESDSPRIAGIYLDVLQNVLQPQGPKKAYFYLASQEALTSEDVAAARNSLRKLYGEVILERETTQFSEIEGQLPVTNNSFLEP